MKTIYKKLNDVNSILNNIAIEGQKNIVLLANAFNYLQEAISLLEQEILNSETPKKE